MTKKKIIVLVLVLAAAVGGAYYFTHNKKNSGAMVETAQAVTRGDIEQTITSQGKLEPKEYVDVGAQVSGQLKKLAVEVGQDVKKGDLIAEIDSKIYDDRVAAAEAQLKTLQAQLAEQQANTILAQQQADRNQRLYKSKAVSKDLLQTTNTALKVAQARVASLQAQIESSQSGLQEEKTNLSYTTIYAPIDGTVVSQTSREGQTLNANQTAPVIVQLANLNTMTVRAQVAEADVLNVKPEMDVYFTILGNSTRKWQGKVRQVLPSPETVNAVVLYDVLVDVDNADHQLMTGMTTQMFFVRGSAKNVIIVPVSALIKPMPDKNDTTKGDAYLVHVKIDGKNTKKIIYVGLQDRTQAEVKEGLSEGDQIITETHSVDKAAAGGASKMRMGPRL